MNENDQQEMNKDDVNANSDDKTAELLLYLVGLTTSLSHMYCDVSVKAIGPDADPWKFTVESPAVYTWYANMKCSLVLNSQHPLIQEALSILQSHQDMQALRDEISELSDHCNALRPDPEDSHLSRMPLEVYCWHIDDRMRRVEALGKDIKQRENQLKEKFITLVQEHNSLHQIIKMVEERASWIEEEIEEARKRYEQNRKPKRSLAETPAREGDVRIKFAGVTKIIFSPEDEEKLKNMSKKEAYKYKKELIDQGKFTEEWIPAEDWDSNPQ